MDVPESPEVIVQQTANEEVVLHVGYDGTEEALSTLCASEDKIDYLYTGICLDVMGGGRRQGIADFRNLRRQVEMAEQAGIKLSLVINDPVLYDYRARRDTILDAIRACRDQGIAAFTAANPRLIVDLHELDVEVFMSTIANVDTPEKLELLLDLPFTTLIPAYSCNRNLDMLRKMAQILSSAGRHLMLIVDELCPVPCPYRNFHFAANGTQQEDVSRFYLDWCNRRLEESPHLLLANSSIPPQLLSRYTDVCRHFKLSTRMEPATRILNLVRMYRNRRLDGNYFELIRKGEKRYYLGPEALESLWELWPNCKNHCSTCGKCFEVELETKRGIRESFP
jgi:collagenase-like PrtC family protease